MHGQFLKVFGDKVLLRKTRKFNGRGLGGWLLTPHRHLILPLMCLDIRVCPILGYAPQIISGGGGVMSGRPSEFICPQHFMIRNLYVPSD